MAKVNNAAWPADVTRRTLIKWLPTVVAGGFLPSPNARFRFPDQSAAGAGATRQQIKNMRSDRRVFQQIASNAQLTNAVRSCAYEAVIETSCLLAYNGDDPARRLTRLASDHPRFRHHVLLVLQANPLSPSDWPWPAAERSHARQELDELFRQSLVARYPTDRRLVAEVQGQQLEEALSGVTRWVGTFWCVHDEGGVTILADRVPLTHAADRGGVLVSQRSPQAVWARWQKLGYLGIREVNMSRRIVRNDWEHFPRGSIAYCTVQMMFILNGPPGRTLPPFRLQQLRSVFCPDGQFSLA